MDKRTLSKDETVLVKQFETGIEASVNTELGSRGLEVRRRNGSSSTGNDPPNKKQKN